MRYPKQFIESVEKLYQEHSLEQCSKILGIDKKKLKSLLSNHKITCNREYLFNKNQTPWNKGKKGTNTGAVATQFKKGQPSVRKQPVGTIKNRKRNDTIVSFIKLENGTWEKYANIIWKQNFGEMPEGHAVYFKDKDGTNVNPENLQLLSVNQFIEKARNKNKTSESLKVLYRRERIRKRYGMSPISGHGKRLTNFY